MGAGRPKMKRPAHLADLLATAFAGKPAEARFREMRIWQEWEAAVGPQIAAKAHPSAIRDGVLTVRVAGSAWMQQLSLLKGEIIARLNETTGTPLVRDIFFRQGEVRREENAPSSPPPSRKLTPDETSWVRSQGETVSDPELRRTLESLLTRHLQSLPDDQP